MAWCQPARSPSWQDGGMERVVGIGGYFMRAADPAALGAWYRECLGLDADENGLWRQEPGPTVFATFESGTDYFGARAQQVMLNFRVRDLDAMLAQLRAKGADVAGETQEMEGVGRFGWVTDPEGNRVELGSPPDRVLTLARCGCSASGAGAVRSTRYVTPDDSSRLMAPAPSAALGSAQPARATSSAGLGEVASQQFDECRRGDPGRAGRGALDAFTTLTGWSVSYRRPSGRMSRTVITAGK